MPYKKHPNRPPSKDQFHGVIEKLPSTPQEITAKQDVAGDAEVTTFLGNNKFRWKKGDQLELAIWHGDVDAKGGCIGVVKIGDVYALPRFERAFHSVQYQDFDYKGYSVFKGLSVSILVRELKPLPKPPAYR
jgi:hypothetical protein